MGRVSALLQHKIMSAEDAARQIGPDRVVGFSGFTMVGYPKAIPHAMAELGLAKNLTVLTGASVGDVIDGELCRAGLLKRRYPYQTNKELRAAVNRGDVLYADLHLSQMPSQLNMGVGPHIDFAVVECAAVTNEGLIPTASVGASDSFVRNADKVIVEVNQTVPAELAGIHDIYEASTPYHPKPIPIVGAADRPGLPYIPCPPEKVAAIVLANEEGDYPVFREPDDISLQIAENIVGFLKREIAANRLPPSLFPLQSGVGNIANAVLAGLAKSELRGLSIYTEVLQDSAFDLVTAGTVTSASATALSLSREKAAQFYVNLDYYKERVVLRGQEISNHPEIIRRVGLISMNTPVECDLFGNVNSTHVAGTDIINGIGGSGDFARNAALTIFACPSTARHGAVSAIVPMASHVDHTEHDVMAVVTERGVADLRWKAPAERAELMIKHCAHPDYQDALRRYLSEAKKSHIPHSLDEAFRWHTRFLERGDMREK